MKKITTDEQELLTGGLCLAEGPGNSNGNSNVTCTGLCLASVISFINSNGNSNVGIILC